MERSLLSRLQTNGIYYLIGALLLLFVIPGYQLFVLTPLGYSNALHAAGPTGHIAAYLVWISSHTLYFIIHHLLLALSFAALLTLPFSLFRIIIAQELFEEQESAEQGQDEAEESATDATERTSETTEPRAAALPPEAWRGKGFAVIAAWAGLFGLVIYILGTLADMVYFSSISAGFSARSPLPDGLLTFSRFFTIATNTVGIGLLALSTLFFGAIIARRGRNLWPGIWVFFAYMAIAVAALFSGSAVAIASAPAEGQAELTSPAILLFAIWTFWLGIMLVRLKPEE